MVKQDLPPQWEETLQYLQQMIKKEAENELWVGSLPGSHLNGLTDCIDITFLQHQADIRQ